MIIFLSKCKSRGLIWADSTSNVGRARRGLAEDRWELRCVTFRCVFVTQGIAMQTQKPRRV